MLQLPVAPGPAAVDSALARVLARPEFAAPRESALHAALRRLGNWILDRIVDLLRWLFPRLARSSEAWSAYGRVALMVLAVLGALLLGYVVYLVARNERRRRARLVAAETPPRPLTATEWEARARAAGAAGHWREAALALYQAVLHRLADRGTLRLDPAKTPGDYRRETRRRDVGPTLESFLRAFEPVAFGPGHPQADAYARLRGLAAPLGAHG